MRTTPDNSKPYACVVRVVCDLSTGQKFQSPQEILKFFGEVEGEVAQEIKAVAEEGLERSPKCFFKGIGRCWS